MSRTLRLFEPPKWDNRGAPVVLSYGGGVNSPALLIGMVRREERIDLILFADTGGERPDVYDGVDRVSSWSVARGYPPIETVRATVKREHRGHQPGDVVTLEQNCLELRRLPSLAYGFKSCSERWKQRPIHDAIKTWPAAQATWADGGQVVMVMGIDADETYRERAPDQGPFRVRYPLIEWDWGREECLEAIESEGLGPAAKSACFFCPAHSEPEIAQLGELYPDLLKRALALEANARAPGDLVPSLQQAIQGRPWREVWAAYKRGEPLNGTRMELPCGCFDGSMEGE